MATQTITKIVRGVLSPIIVSLKTTRSQINLSLTSIFNALTTLQINLGPLPTLQTVTQVNVVDAINEVLTDVNNETLRAEAAENNETTARVAAVLAETTRAEAAEGTLSSLTTSTKTNLVSAINSVVTSIAAETTRAETAENNETTARVAAVLAEQQRAEAAETVLTNNIGPLASLSTTTKANLVAAINEVLTDVNNETLRAETAENLEIITRAAAVLAETTRAEAAETVLTNNIGPLASLSTVAKTNLISAVNEVVTDVSTEASTRATAISTETTRAEAAENGIIANVGLLSSLTTTTKANLVAAINEAITDINNEVVARTAALLVETNRAEGVEGILSSLTTTAKNNLVAAINEAITDINNETLRAETAENNETTARVAAVSAETTRAEAAETVLTNNIGPLASLSTVAKTNLISAVNEVLTDVNNETLRAEAAENNETTARVAAVSAETLRAETAENLEIITRAAAVLAETTRAEGVEGILSSLTTTAKNNLVAAINEVLTDVNNETLRAETAEGTLSSLTTTAKNNLVAAINEVLTDVNNEAATRVTAISNLQTQINTLNTQMASIIAGQVVVQGPPSSNWA